MFTTSKLVFFAKFYCGMNFLIFLSLIEFAFKSDESLIKFKKLPYLYQIPLNIFHYLLNSSITILCAQSAGTVEYTDCISAEE